MQMSGYTTYKADPDAWMKMMVRPKDRFENYAHVLPYVDDNLCNHHDAQLDKAPPNETRIYQGPDIYLGTKRRRKADQRSPRLVHEPQQICPRSTAV